MKKLVLIDGNNLMFRSFYAIRDNGGNLRTSSGLSTNALYGFTNMINKIILEEEADHIVVAFDKGKNFRKEEFSFYKDGRKETPTELKEQFPYAKKMLTLMGIKYLELEPYEADDIIGTLSKKFNDDVSTVIISSDVDLMQLIDKNVEMKRLKQKGFVRYNKDLFFDEYKLDPIKIIDLKSLMGDSSDNIPGVKGIGEKTALKLLQEYGSLDGVYENIDKIKGSVQNKLVIDKENAYISYKLATIYNSVPLDYSLDDLKYMGESDELYDLYEELEFKSFLKNRNVSKKEKIEFSIVDSVSDVILPDYFSLYADLNSLNYHDASLLGFSVFTGDKCYYFEEKMLDEFLGLCKDKKICTYNIKKHIKFFGNIFSDDLMISEFLLNRNVKDDITSIMNDDEFSFSNMKKNKFIDVSNSCCLKSSFIFNLMSESKKTLDEEGLLDLYKKIEIPLSGVLYEMENFGVRCLEEVLDNLQENILKDIALVSREIWDLAGEEFNIQSPKQLGDILFEKLVIGKGKKNKSGYVTDAKTLEKLKDKHEIINKILLHRNLVKINSTYIEGIKSHIRENGNVRCIFNQTLARTGRLSCSEPNLQNIPVREELGRQIRKAFVPKNDLFLSADYSQIELRILAHISKDEKLISAFNENKDIHRAVAADMYNKCEEDITKVERKTAKAVIFGIVYGISGFGLGENLKITTAQASLFIKKYYELYPNVKKYMDDIIIKTKECGYVTTLYNRKRKIEEIRNSNFLVRQMGERMALNTPIQGTSADIIKDAMIKIDEELTSKNLKSKMVLQVHDELIFDVVKEEEEIIRELVIRNMENIIKLDVPLLVEVSTGTNWFEV